MAVSSETSASTSSLSTQAKNVGLIFLGAVILGLHVIIYMWSPVYFNIFMCMYILAFAILVLIKVNKYQSCFKPSSSTLSDYNILAYISIYTILLEAVIFILIIGTASYNMINRKPMLY